MGNHIDRIIAQSNFPLEALLGGITPSLSSTVEIMSGSGHPVSDVYSTQDKDGYAVLHYEFAVPGISPGDISVSVDAARGVLTIKNMSEEGKLKERKDRKYYSNKISRKRFANMIHIPQGYEIDDESVEVKLGILSFSFRPTKARKESARNIPIRT